MGEALCSYTTNGRPRRLGVLSSLLAHPSVPFTGAWLIVLVCNELTIVDIFAKYRSHIRYIAMGLLASNWFGALGISLCYSRRIFTRLWYNPAKGYRYKYILLTGWMGISILETILSGGWPLCWMLTGVPRTYEDFGIPSLHGFANALWLFLTFAFFTEFYHHRRWRDGVILAALFGWTVLVLSRAMFSILFLQCAFYYLLTTRTNRLVLGVQCMMVIVAFVFLFGFAGNSRVEEFSISASVGREQVSLAEDSFLWVYSYTVSPVANLAHNIASEEPSYTFPPPKFLRSMLPTALRRAIGMETGFDSHAGALAHTAFNVGTAFWEIYLDLGICGVAFYAFALGMIGHVCWKSGMRSDRLEILTYFGVCAGLSIFSNQFTQLTVLLNFVLLRLPKH